MQVVVPLAGPDLVDCNGDIKPLKLFSGQPFLKRVLDSRPWSALVTNYLFVLINDFSSRQIVQHIEAWYPDAGFVFLSTHTRGAACSVLAAIALQANVNEPIIVDLADISYTSDINIVECLTRTPLCGALALTFKSNKPIYSYLATDSAGIFVEAAEKKVISSNASVGTYIFRSSIVYLRALAHSFENELNQTFNGSFYVCPLMNGVLSQGLTVQLRPVSNIYDPKICS